MSQFDSQLLPARGRTGVRRLAKDVFLHKLSGIICDTDFEATGRTADVLGLEGCDVAAIKAAFFDGATPLVTA